MSGYRFSSSDDHRRGLSIAVAASALVICRFSCVDFRRKSHIRPDATRPDPTRRSSRVASAATAVLTIGRNVSNPSPVSKVSFDDSLASSRVQFAPQTPSRRNSTTVLLRRVGRCELVVTGGYQCQSADSANCFRSLSVKNKSCVCRPSSAVCRQDCSAIHRVKRRHRVYGHDTIAILWV